MKLGLQISSFTWPGGPAAIGPTLARIVRTADDVGFDSIWVMDHFFQIREHRPPRGADARGLDRPRLHGRPLGRARLGLLVGGVHYRHAGLWVKADDDPRRAVRRAGLARHRRRLERGARVESLGFPFPPLGVRFELLEDTLRFAHGMWQGERGSEERLERPPPTGRRGC